MMTLICILTNTIKYYLTLGILLSKYETGTPQGLAILNCNAQDGGKRFDPANSYIVVQCSAATKTSTTTTVFSFAVYLGRMPNLCIHTTALEGFHRVQDAVTLK